MALLTEILKPRVLSPYGGSIVDTSSTEVTPPPLTIATSPTTTRGQIAAPTGPAPDTNPLTQAPQSGTWSGGLAAPVTIVAAPTTPTTTPTATTGTTSGTTGGTGPGGIPLDTSGGPVGTPSQDQLTNRLLDLIAAQYAGGLSAGQNPDFGGLLTAPVGPATGAPDASGTDSSGLTTTAAAPKQSHPLLVILLIVGVIGGVYWWRKHHKKKAA
jgi:hypothetical protein